MNKEHKIIPLSRPLLSDEEKAAVMAVLDSGRYVKGEQNKEFEKEFAKYCNVKHGITFSSGTAALHTALVALGIGHNDEVITTPHTFFATIEAIMLVGAKPVFVDIDPATYNIDVNKIGNAITKKTKAIIPVHLYGHPVNMDVVMNIAKKEGLYVIEDAAQAHGAEYDGRKVGSFGDIACFSFYPSKNLMVANEGGAAITNNDSLAEKIHLFKDHGRTSFYAHQVLGLNYNLGEIQAAIARIQLRKLDQNNEKRKHLTNIYRKEIRDSNLLVLPTESQSAKHVYHLFVIQHENRDLLKKMLGDRNIQTGIHYPIACHMQPAYTNMYGNLIKMPNAEKITKRVLSLPMHQNILEDDIHYVAETISSILKEI